MASLLGDHSGGSAAPGGTGTTSVDDLEPNPFQPRGPVSERDLTELAASIREQGLLQPILIRRHPSKAGKFQIVAGERRWRAAKLAGLTTVATLQRDLPDLAAGAAALVENLQRQDLNPIEEAEGFRRLIDGFGLTQEDLAKAIGKSRSHVANQLRLLTLPSETIQYVRDGKLTAGHARAALACDDPAAAAETMVTRGLNVRQAEALASPQPKTEPMRQPSESTLGCGSTDLRAVEADLTELLGLKVSISFNGKGGTLRLQYLNLDQLDYVVGRLGHRA